jgi:type IV secretory pathway VirB2 component (pilin)
VRFQGVTLYLLLLYLLSLALAFDLALTRTTLSMARSIAAESTARGIQNAITPPASTTLGLTVYGLVLAGIGYGWYRYGWRLELLAVPGFLLATSMNLLLIPKPGSAFFRGIVLRSLSNRFANYVKTGDDVRGAAVADLGRVR